MATLHVRNVPDDLYELLRQSAAQHDRSIGAETIHLLHDRLVLADETVRRLAIPGRRRRLAGPIGTFTRFTAEARQAVVAAQAEARALGHPSVGTEHLLLGVLAQDVPVSRSLRDLGLTLEHVRSELVASDERAPGQIPFHPEAKRALEIALREATKLDHTVIAPLHVVLGIAGAEAGRGAEILRRAEPDAARLRRCLLGSVGAPPFQPAATVSFRPAAPATDEFRVVPLEGDATEWESRLNDAAALGYELLEIVDGRAVFRR